MSKAAFFLAGTLGLANCGVIREGIIKPAGPIAESGRDLLFVSVLMMTPVVLPVFVMTVWICFRYRAGGAGAYRPNWDRAPLVDAIIWLVPAGIVVTLGAVLWQYTHRLDPYRTLQADLPALEVQAIGTDWKWVFVYPEQNIATINELAFPAERSLTLRITSDTVMNSLMIPALGGQMYAMAGMETRLNLKADAPGGFVGRNTQFSGAGFPGQSFSARAMDNDAFEAWVGQARGSNDVLDLDRFNEVAKPSSNDPVQYFSNPDPTLFQSLIEKYAPGPHH